MFSFFLWILAHGPYRVIAVNIMSGSSVHSRGHHHQLTCNLFRCCGGYNCNTTTTLSVGLAHPVALLRNTFVAAIYSSCQRRRAYATSCQSGPFRTPMTPVLGHSKKSLHGVKAFTCVNCPQTQQCGHSGPRLVSASGSIQST